MVWQWKMSVSFVLETWIESPNPKKKRKEKTQLDLSPVSEENLCTERKTQPHSLIPHPTKQNKKQTQASNRIHGDPRKVAEVQIPFSGGTAVGGDPVLCGNDGAKIGDPIGLFLATTPLHGTRSCPCLRLCKDLSFTSHRHFPPQGSPWLRRRPPWTAVGCSQQVRLGLKAWLRLASLIRYGSESDTPSLLCTLLIIATNSLLLFLLHLLSWLF